MKIAAPYVLEYRDAGNVQEVTLVCDDGWRFVDRSTEHVEKLGAHARLFRQANAAGYFP